MVTRVKMPFRADQTARSPFFVIEEFVSPLMCETMLESLDYTVPDVDKEGAAISSSRTNERAASLVYARLMDVVSLVEEHFRIKYKGTESINFEWFPEGSSGEFRCENSVQVRNKWLRTKAVDLTAILFLSEYQDNPPISFDFEVYGGKLEFVQHQFSFQPNRGTLVVFPSDPHFINVTSPILAGDLHQVRVGLVAEVPYIYNPQEFPGTFEQWFSPLLSQ